MLSIFGFLFAVFLCVFSAAGQALAAGSGAYRLEVASADAAGKGLAFAGEANTPSALYYNPAGMTQSVGQAVSFGATLIQPRTRYKDSSGEGTSMKPGNFVIPNVYYVTDLGTKNFSLGLGVISSWGLTTDWRSDSFARYTATKTVMTNYDYLIAGAYRVDDQLSVAIGLDIDDSTVDKKKRIDQSGVGGADGDFRLKGSDTAFGFRIAGLYKLNERHQFGLVYKSRIRHKYEGKVTLQNLDPTVQFLYDFSASSYETDAVSKSTLPESLVLGYSYRPSERWTFNADLEWMNWSVVEQEEVTFPSESTPKILDFLSQGNPAPRDWKSSLSLATGAEYRMSDRFRLRGGYYYHQSPLNKKNWEPALPDSSSHGVTAGFGYDLHKNLTLDFAWSGLFYQKARIENGVDGGRINGTYYKWCNLVYSDVTYHF